MLPLLPPLSSKRCEHRRMAGFAFPKQYNEALMFLDLRLCANYSKTHETKVCLLRRSCALLLHIYPLLLRNATSSKWTELPRMAGFARSKTRRHNQHGSRPGFLLLPLKRWGVPVMSPPAKLNNYGICLSLLWRKTTSSKQEDV